MPSLETETHQIECLFTLHFQEGNAEKSDAVDGTANMGAGVSLKEAVLQKAFAGFFPEFRGVRPVGRIFERPSGMGHGVLSCSTLAEIG